MTNREATSSLWVWQICQQFISQQAVQLSHTCMLCDKLFEILWKLHLPGELIFIWNTMTAYFVWPVSDLWPVLATSIDFRFQFALQLCYAGPAPQSLLISTQLAFCFGIADDQSFVFLFTCVVYPVTTIAANRIVSTAEILLTGTTAAYQVIIWFTNSVYADTSQREATLPVHLSFLGVLCSECVCPVCPSLSRKLLNRSGFNLILGSTIKTVRILLWCL
jgi:hypothetical protein